MNNTTKTTFGFRRIAATGAMLAALGASLVLSSRPAAATDSGLGFYPTADIYPDGNFHFDYDTFGSGLKTNTATSVGLEYGFGKGHDGLFGRNEVGADYIVSGFALPSASKRIAFNFKTQLYNNDKAGMRLALGIANVGDKSLGRTDVRLLGYKAFSFGRVHAGVWRGLSRGALDSTNGFQLGIDKTMGKFVIGADYRTGPTGVLAPCIIYNFNDKAGIELCSGRANSTGAWTTYMAFDYNFDFKKPAAAK